jgi:hypothetical protein
LFGGILYHFSHRLVKYSVSHLHANAFRQTKMIMRAREN